MCKAIILRNKDVSYNIVHKLSFTSSISCLKSSIASFEGTKIVKFLPEYKSSVSRPDVFTRSRNSSTYFKGYKTMFHSAYLWYELFCKFKTSQQMGINLLPDLPKSHLRIS